MDGQLFVLSAPSGAGKSSIVAAVREGFSDLKYSISHTSRKPRPGEKEGEDYHFVDVDTFRRMMDEGAFVEWAQVYDAYYGTSLAALERGLAGGYDLLLDLDIQGARNLKKRFKKCVLIYVVPPSLEVLEKRLRGRGTESAEAMRSRLAKARQEIEAYTWYDYVVINDDLPRAVEEVRAVILSERCRSERRAPLMQSLFGSPR